tara:strand:+ start:1177 stop:2157 length:981 start_codon:yes stop_codon:yes gene_type:complete
VKKALITGINGQDGSYLSKFLLQKGYKVYGILRNSTVCNLDNLEFLGVKDQLELFPANLSDLSNVIRLVDKIIPDEIYNLAAQSSVALSFQQPIGTIEFNILSTINLLEAIRIRNTKIKFYQASSSEMYGKVMTFPVNEETVLHPVSPYAISKATGHWMAVNSREAYGLFSCCGILFNHESVLRAEHFVTKKILSTAVRISKGSQEELRLGSIEIKRDWGYAPYYVEAMWLMLQQDNADDYVIATNEVHSLKEFIQIVFDSLGLDWENYVIIDKNLYRPSEIDVMYGSPEKAKRKLGWRYDLSFQELIRRLVKEETEYQENKENQT